jgi:RNA methyltransferase, TrmH family
MEPVRSPRNAKVAEASRLRRARDRRAAGLTLLEGPHVLKEALHAGADIRRIFALVDDEVAGFVARHSGAELIVVEQAVLDRLAPTESPRGPIAVMAIPPPGVGRADTVVMAVTDPGNAGTIIRTAASFGFDVSATAGAVDVWSPKVVRAGAGAHFRTRFVQEAPSAGIATVVSGGIAPRDLAIGAGPGSALGGAGGFGGARAGDGPGGLGGGARDHPDAGGKRESQCRRRRRHRHVRGGRMAGWVSRHRSR